MINTLQKNLQDFYAFLHFQVLFIDLIQKIGLWTPGLFQQSIVLK